jgi:starch phosphorylase
VKIETSGGRHAFEVQVYLKDLDPNAVRVELYPDGADGPAAREMMCVGPLAGAEGGYVYSASAPATRPAGDYTPRVIPSHAGAAVPLEAAQILWQC